MQFWPGLLVGIFMPPVSTWLWVPFGRWSNRRMGKGYGAKDFAGDWLGNSFIQMGLSYFAFHWMGVTTGNVISAVIAAVFWWSKRKRRRSLELLGEKSRALRNALVRNMPRRTITAPVR